MTDASEMAIVAPIIAHARGALAFGDPDTAVPPRRSGLSGFIRGGRMDDEVERAAVAQPHGGKVPDVSRRKATDAKIFGERDHGCVHKAEAEIREALIDLHRP